MAYLDFLSSLHKSTARDYLARVNEYPKAEAAKKAKQYGADYWDGDRRFGYGGYRYDGRWKPVAEALVDHYKLTSQSSILDVGCGKAFLLYELSMLLPGARVCGIDISTYAIEHAKEEVRPFLKQCSAESLPFRDQEFDFVYSLNTLFNLKCYDMLKAMKEIERVAAKHKYVVMESYRTEEEKVNLLYWQLTCQCFFSPDEWEWWFKTAGYTGDHSFIFFE